MTRADVSHRLLRHGLTLILLGLVTGLAMIAARGAFANLRMAVSSHVIGVLGGMLLLITGLVAVRVQLPARVWTLAYGCALYGAYGNWAGTFLAAVFGTGSLAAVSAAGYAGKPWQELLVGFVLTTSGTGALLFCALLLWGLRREGDLREGEAPAEPRRES